MHKILEEIESLKDYKGVLKSFIKEGVIKMMKNLYLDDLVENTKKENLSFITLI